LWLDGAEHNDFFQSGGQRIDDAIGTFVAALSGATP
jgi:hypothetical protein